MAATQKPYEPPSKGDIAEGADEIEPDRRPMTLGNAALGKVALSCGARPGATRSSQVPPSSPVPTAPTLLSPIGVLG
jgi:hypothetical protein